MGGARQSPHLDVDALGARQATRQPLRVRCEQTGGEGRQNARKPENVPEEGANLSDLWGG